MNRRNEPNFGDPSPTPDANARGCGVRRCDASVAHASGSDGGDDPALTDGAGRVSDGPPARPRARDGVAAMVEIGAESPIPSSPQQGGDELGLGDLGVGQAVVAALVGVRELAVVEAQGVEQGGLEVVDGDGVFDGGVAELVGRAVDVAPLEAAAGQPEREAVAVVVAAVGPLRDRQPAELAGPEDDRVVEQPALLQVRGRAPRWAGRSGRRATSASRRSCCACPRAGRS